MKKNLRKIKREEKIKNDEKSEIDESMKTKENITKIDKKITKKCKCKYRTYLYTISTLLIVYFLLIIFAKNINSFLIFPEVFLDKWNKAEVNYIEWEKKELIFYFAWNDSLVEINHFKDLWYNVAIFDYTKDIKENYEIREEEINAKAETFFNLITSEKGIEKQNVIVLWKDKWSIFASNFSLKNNIDKLILISPILSSFDYSKEKYWFIFQKALFLQNITSKKSLNNFYNNSLIISSNKNNYFNNSKDLFRIINGNKYFLELDDLTSENVLKKYSIATNELLKQFISGFWIKKRFNFIDKIELESMLEEIEYNRIFESVDLLTDSSLTKFVNNKVPFDNVWYVPTNLVPVWWKHIIDSKWWSMKVKEILKENLLKMANDFYEDTKNNIVVVSAYRSYNYQKWIKDRWCPDNLCAKAGYSEHQTWLTIDLYSASSNRNWANDNTLQKYYKWLSANAHKYGFTNTYQKWLEVDWYEIEPWHWRYVWEDLATLLKENNITLAEFYNLKMTSNY